MKNKNLSWAAALFVFALLLWCTAATPGNIADPSTYTCAVYSTFFSLLPPVIAIVLALNTKEVYTSLLVGIASGALLYANGNLELALNTLFFHEEGGMIAKLSDSSNVGILVFLVMLGILVALMNKAGGSAGGMLSVYYITRNTLYLTCKGKSAAYKKLKTVIPILTGAARYALTKALGRKKGRSYGAYRGAVDFWQGKMGRMEG